MGFRFSQLAADRPKSGQLRKAHCGARWVHEMQRCRLSTSPGAGAVSGDRGRRSLRWKARASGEGAGLLCVECDALGSNSDLDAVHP